MKIGFDAKRAFHNNTGLGNYSRDTIRILTAFYSNNTYFLYNPKPAKKNRLTLKSNTKEVLPKSFINKKLSSVWRQKEIVKQLIADKIDIYHGLSGELPRGIDKTNIKTVVTIHDLIFVRYPKLYSYIDRKIHFNKFKHAAQIADVVIAISEQTKRDIIQFLGIKPAKIKVLYQGCNNVFKREFTKEEKKTVVQRFNLPKNYILNVGTVEERKNVLNLVKAIEDTNQKLVIVGSTKSDYAKKVQQYIKEKNLESKVQFLKNVSMKELAIIYQMASLFVYPSIFEGFGIPIIEALYSKTPVISSKGGCFSEAGGGGSIYIDPLNVQELKKAINLVLKDTKLQKKMVEKGLNYVKRFNDDIIAANLHQVYSNLLND